MKMAREAGFTKAVVTYTAFYGLNLYYQDTAAMKAAGFTDYSQFLKARLHAVQQHAEGGELAAGLLEPGRRADRRRR